MAKMLDELKSAIEASGKSRYRIAQDTGVAESGLSRLMSGQQGLSIESAEVLAEYLGLEVIVRPKRRERRKKGRS